MNLVVVLLCMAGGAALVVSIGGLKRLRWAHLATYGSPLLLLSLRNYTGSWHASATFAALELSLVVGYCGALLESRRKRTNRGRKQRRARRAQVPAVVTFVGLLSAYHFYKVGIPILSGDPEHARLVIGASGLFGLPSRMYLYGTFVACALAVSDAWRRQIPVTRDKWVRVAFAVLVATRLLSGFKSGVFQAFLFGLLIFIVGSNGIPLRRNLWRFVIIAAIASSAVFLVGATYQSYRSAGTSLWSSLERRVTTQSAAGVAVVIADPRLHLGDNRPALVMDEEYLVNEYSHLGSPHPYGFTRLVAADLSGSNPSTDVAIAPVTTSGAGELFYDFRYGAILVLMLWGVIIAKVEKIGAVARARPLAFSAACTFLQMSLDVVSKGDTVYQILNWTLTFLFLTGFAVVLRALRTFPRSTPSARPGHTSWSPTASASDSTDGGTKIDLGNSLSSDHSPRADDPWGADSRRRP